MNNRVQKFDSSGNYISEVTDEFKAELYVDEFKKKNKEILKIEKELKKLKKK